MYTQAQKKAHIHELQEMLYCISMHDPSIPHVVPDGIYSPQTAEAVRRFQAHAGLQVTGEVTSADWEAIAAAARSLTEAEHQPALLCEGDTGLAVRILQSVLLSAAEAEERLTRCAVTGRFDRETVQALEQFQRLCGLPVTGAADAKTWRRIAEAGEALSGRSFKETL